jgi:Zn-finger nucleic acid-binding protein
MMPANVTGMIPVCPKCDVGLLILRFKTIEVDHCERCRGIWLDAGELEQLLSATGGDATDPLLQFQQLVGSESRNRKRLCPRCDQSLREITAGSGLKLDRCPRGHGLWFDADELRQLLALFPASSGAGRTIESLNEIFGTVPTT